ncbi:hypothetical protein BLNAU_17292 [Blattamonas nauphoetae]|uniref:Uncharacterized protein n=1 Tax=Blattamonas nauphoetae TaxID=2049346 RepID=A0ABQ9X7Q1_9EUKA|nr:hypothetical protein BLNAU_17292 [Blattamonas nauphoetae]
MDLPENYSVEGIPKAKDRLIHQIKQLDELTTKVQLFLSGMISETDSLLNDAFVDDSFTNSLAEHISTIPSAVAQETLDQTISQALTFRTVGAQDPCPLRFDLPPYSIPSTMPLSLIVPPFNVYAFTIPNFTHSAEYDEFVESPSSMTPPFPFKFRLRVWPRGSAREDSPEDIRVAIVLERGYSTIVEEFEKTLRLRESPKDDTTIYSLRKPYTFDVRVEMLSEYPEKAKKSSQFPFRKEGMAEFKVGEEVVLTSFIKKKEVVDGRLMWQERLAAHFLFGWRFPNYMRMADAYHLSFLEWNKDLIPSKK